MFTAYQNTRVTLLVETAQGYSADQVETRLTLAELRDVIEMGIETYGPNAVVVIEDAGNRMASFGRIIAREVVEMWADMGDEEE